MYRPRHARPRRLPKMPVLGALLLTPAVALPLGSARPTSALVRTADTAAPHFFVATPLVIALHDAPRPAPATRPLPARDALRLPATLAPGETPRPTRLTGADRAVFQTASREVAGLGCDVPWQLLVAIRAVVAERPPTLLDGHAGYLMADADKGRYDGSVAADGPVGPMGLLPWTFERVEAAAGANPTRLPDAAEAAARYLCAVSDGRLETAAGARAALLAYDPDPAFARAVLTSEH